MSGEMKITKCLAALPKDWSFGGDKISFTVKEGSEHVTPRG